MTNPRVTAALILEKVLYDKQSLSGLLPPDSLVRAICYGVLRHLPQLQFFAARLLKKPLAEQDVSVQLLLLIGFYQLIDMDTPDHAAISETVEAARELDKEWACGLINGVLRTFQREYAALDRASQHNEEAFFLHPDWLIKMIRKAWPEHWEDILHANNVKAPMFLRVNQRKVTPANYLTQLGEAGLSAKAHPDIASCIQLEEPINVHKLPGFEAGWVSVQDAAAQRVASLMHLKPGLKVLDACAAPGGKTMHMLEQEPHLEYMLALDIDTHRIQQVRDNLRRLQLNAHVIAADAHQTHLWWKGQLFDRILVDAPCSGTGVIRRHPDIKVLRRPKDFETLPRQQIELLKKMWPMLKPQGLLVYTTCSIMPQENDQVIEKFLQEHPNAKTENIEFQSGFKTQQGWQCLPEANGPDGFYYAVLKKSAV